jgi:hypothetical protein
MNASDFPLLILSACVAEPLLQDQPGSDLGFATTCAARAPSKPSESFIVRSEPFTRFPA